MHELCRCEERNLVDAAGLRAVDEVAERPDEGVASAGWDFWEARSTAVAGSPAVAGWLQEVEVALARGWQRWQDRAVPARPAQAR